MSAIGDGELPGDAAAGAASANAQDAAHAALFLVPQWHGSQARIVRTLGGGPGNDVWLVECDGQDYVLRLDTALTPSLALDRAGEAAIASLVGVAGIAPDLVFALPERGLQVTRFVAGQSWSAPDLAARANLQRLAAVLRELHALSPDVRRSDISRSARAYAESLAHAAGGNRATDAPPWPSQDTDAHPGHGEVFEPPTGAQAADWAGAVDALLISLAPRPPTLCHNDLVATNIVDSATRLWLIDWEYAGLGDPFFDLAIVTGHHRLDATRERWLLDAYLGDVRDEDLARLRDYRRIYDYVVLLWLAVVARQAPLTTEQLELWRAAKHRVGLGTGSSP